MHSLSVRYHEMVFRVGLHAVFPITAVPALLLLFCIHFLCGINKYCFVRAYMLSFLHSFPTYPSAIQSVVTAVVYMALQA